MSKFDRFDPKHRQRFRLIDRTEREKSETEQRIKNWISRKNRVRYSIHALEMMAERCIDDADVGFVLENGKHKETREYEHRIGKPREVFEGTDFDQINKLRVVVREEETLWIITAIVIGDENEET